MKHAWIVGLTLALALPAAAEEVYWTTPALLRDFFRTSKRVTYTEVRTAEHAEALRAALGYLPPREKYVVFVAKTGERVDGYAVVDEQKGQHRPITFGTLVTPAGDVARTEVMAYREGYGHEIREARFRRQFDGKGAADALRLGEDVVAISGATISADSMAVAVRRAVILVALVRGEQPSPPTARRP